MWTREQVIASIEANTNTFFVLDSIFRKRADIGVVRETGKLPYLRTYADGKWNNNFQAVRQDKRNGLLRFGGGFGRLFFVLDRSGGASSMLGRCPHAPGILGAR